MTRKLDRLNRTNSSGVAFQRLWQRTAEAIEAQFTDLFAALSSMPDIPSITVTADYTGTIDPGQLPRTVQAYRYTNTTDDTANATWSFTVDDGDVTATISDGALEITDVKATSTVTITSDFNGVSKSRSFQVFLNVAAPPSTGGGGGGTTATDTSFASFNSATHAAVSDELTVTVGSAGKVQLSAPLTVSTDTSGGLANYPVFGIWRRWTGLSYADVGTEVESDPDCKVDALNRVSNGTLNVAQLLTGLTPSATEKFKLYARNASGTRTMYLSGTASAVAS